MSRRWSVNEHEQRSLSAALDFMAGHPVRWSLGLYAELLPDDPEPSPKDVTTEVAEVTVSVTAPRWVLE